MPNIKPNIFNGQAIQADTFLADYWQQRPYLFRQTDLPTETVPDRQQLFELANRDGVQSRIIYSEDGQRYRAIYDQPDAWPTVSGHQPTLLVSDIEKWCPQSLAILSALPFIKAWRFDDLMLSYAPKGASVGAHIDQYDVFLVQVKGQRQWSFDDQPLEHFQQVEDSDLAVIDGYQPQHCKTLSPGDVLYLPPQIAHHGISLDDDCLTLSIGLRAPSDAELVTAVADYVAQRLPESARFKDAGREKKATAAITEHEIKHLRQLIERLRHLTNTELADIFGQFISGYRLLDAIPDFSGHNSSDKLQKNPADNFTYYALNEQQAHLYINGEHYDCSLTFAEHLCDQLTFTRQQLHNEQDLLQQLLSDQHIIVAD